MIKKQNKNMLRLRINENLKIKKTQQRVKLSIYLLLPTRFKTRHYLFREHKN